MALAFSLPRPPDFGDGASGVPTLGSLSTLVKPTHCLKSLLFCALPWIGGALTAFAHVGATTPFFSFEAENGALAGGAQVVALTAAPTNEYSSPQLEASGHAYVQLTNTGQSVTWTNTTGQYLTAINVRACIPDAPTGGGITSTIDLYVNGGFRQAFSVNSLQNYCYEGTNYNGQTDKNPADGDPRGFWNDTHAFLAGAPLAPGDTLTLQKDSTNSANFYYLDVVDLEAPPAPLSQPANSLSIVSYGAVSNSPATDNTAAINNCFAAAQAQGKIAWIPPGTFYISAINGGLNPTGITIEGAGPWYSTIYRVTPANNNQGIANIINAVSCTLENVALDCNSSSRAGNNNNGAVDFSGVNWVVNNVWIQHVTSSFWCAGYNGIAENCRTLSTWADGGNFNNVQSANGTGINLTYSNNFVRGTGDDAMAINSVTVNTYGTSSYYYTIMSNITYVNNTAIGPWGGKGIGIYGGVNDVVTNNLLCDCARYIGLGVGKFGVNGSPLVSATVIGNTVLRCGGNGYSQQQPGMMIGNGGDGQSQGSVANAYCADNIISNALYYGVGFTATTNSVFQHNTIISPGLDGIVVGPPTIASGIIGSAILNSNSVTGLASGRVAFANAVANFTAIVPVMAANYAALSGPATEPCTEGGQDLTAITAGNWAAYAGVNLNGANGFVARVAGAANGGNIALHLDSPAGTLIGTCAVPGTGGGQDFTDAYCAVTNASGTHTVYLVFTGGGGNLFNLEFFGFFATPPVFSHQLLPGNTYALKSVLNGHYISATNNGDYVLAANASSVGVPGEFQIYDAGGGNIGLLALVNTNYVCADNDGNNPLIANRTGVGSWETYTEFAGPNGSIGLQAMVNGEYVTVSNTAATLIAQSSTLGTTQAFAVQFVTGAAPASPGGLAASSGSGQVGLAWAASAGATAYAVERSATYSGTYAIIATNLTNPAYTDASLTNGSTYYYVVSAFNPAGVSTNTTPVTAVVGSLPRWSWTLTASSTEANGSPANAIDGDITTRWSSGTPQTNGMWLRVDMGQPATFQGLVLDCSTSAGDYPRGYQVNVSADGVNWGSPVATGAGTSALTPITFPSQTARYVKITQTGSSGGNWWSIDELNALGAAPAAPLALAAASVSGSQINLSWNASTNAGGYNLKRAPLSGGPYTTLAWNLAGTTYADTGLTGGTLYYYVVTATNAFGESPLSNEVAVRPVSTNPPALNYAITGGQLQLDWPTDHTGWRLEVQTNALAAGLGTNWTTVLDSTGTNLLVIPPSLTNGSVFYRLVYP